MSLLEEPMHPGEVLKELYLVAVGLLQNALRLGDRVIPPFLMGSSRRIHAVVFSFIAGVMLPMPMLGRSLL